MSSPVVVVGMNMGVAVLPCVLDTDVAVSALIPVVANVFVPFRVAAIVVATAFTDFVNMVEMIDPFDSLSRTTHKLINIQDSCMPACSSIVGPDRDFHGMQIALSSDPNRRVGWSICYSVAAFRYFWPVTSSTG